MNHPTTSLHKIKPKQTPFASIFKDAFQYGFSSQDTNAHYYKQIHHLNQYTAMEKSVNISQCYMSVDLNQLLYKSPANKERYLEQQQVEFLENDEVYCQSVLDYISQCMERGDVVTITLSLENYIYDNDENTQVTHSTLLILHPITKKGKSTSSYNMFYINSHGGSLIYTNFHEKPIGKTGKRIKKTTFDMPLDFILNNTFVNSLNQYNKEFGLKTKVFYDLTRKYNYLGINLQVYDNHGSCFIFPILFNLLIHANYSKYFINKSDTYSIISEKTVECFLESKEIDLFVYHALGQVDDHINDYLVKYYSKLNRLTNQINRRMRTRFMSNNMPLFGLEDIQDELYDSIDHHLDIYTHRFIKNTLIKTIQFVKQDWTLYQPEVFM